MTDTFDDYSFMQLSVSAHSLTTEDRNFEEHDTSNFNTPPNRNVRATITHKLDQLVTTHE